MSKPKRNKETHVDKLIDFGKELFASVIRSRTGSLSELARILRFKTGTKGFGRQYNKLLPLISKLKEAYMQSVNENFPEEGFRFGIIDDSDLPKAGKTFPKQQKHRNHSDGSYYSGMKLLSSSVYQKGKVATVSSQLVGKQDNKLELSKEEQVEMLISDFFVDIFLFDAWYCKEPLLTKIDRMKKLFVSRGRCDTKASFGEDEARFDMIAKGIPHREYEQIKIAGKSYGVIDLALELKSYGTYRVIMSKESMHEKPIFLITNAYNFSSQFIVKLYLKRSAIEIFYKDAKQFLNLVSFFCRPQEKWDLHLHLTNVLHWAIQKVKSISKTVRAIRENIDDCLLFINQNPLIEKFFEELRRKGLT